MTQSDLERSGRDWSASSEGHPELSLQFGALLDAIPDTLVLLSPELRVLWANEASARKLGLTSRELAGRRCHEVWHANVKPCDVCPVQESYATGRPAARETVDPAGRVWDLRTAPVLSPDGAVAGVIELARDVTEQRHLEGRLVHAQKLEAVGKFAGGIAHDFNNYLAAITGFTELALLELDGENPAREQVTQAREAALRAGAVTRQLLAFSRRETVRRRPLDLAELLASRDGVLRQFAGGDVAFEIRTAPDLGAAEADPGQIEQVLANLIVNAREALPSGGAITIEACNRTVAAGDDGGGLGPGEYVALAVSDSGTGMSEETRRRLFEPFFTTKPSGTGLGLATVQGIARAGGGDVRVESAPGRGTRVEVLLPRTEPPPRRAPAVHSGQLETGTETLLVVEDRDEVRRVAAGILRLLGYTILQARSGAEALEVAAAHPGAVDLLLTDIAMPELSGPELALRFRAVRPGTRLLYMSGCEPDPWETTGPAAPTVRKPFTAKALAEAVRDALATGTAEESA